MRRQIVRLSVHQTAKVLAVLYALMGLVLLPFFLLAALFGPEGAGGIGLGMAIGLPLVYGVLGYVFVAIGCLVYNLVAGWVGGIEVEVTAEQDPSLA